MAVVLDRRRLQRIGTLVFATGTFSTQILHPDYAGFDSISIQAPASFTGDATVRVLRDDGTDETVVGSYNTLHSPPGTPVVAGAGETVVIDALPFAAIALSASSQSGTFIVFGHKATVVAG